MSRFLSIERGRIVLFKVNLFYARSICLYTWKPMVFLVTVSLMLTHDSDRLNAMASLKKRKIFTQ